MKITEKQVETQLRKTVEAVGGKCYKLSAEFDAGFPDRLCVFPGGRTTFVECKAPGEVPRKLQLIILGQLKALGCDVRVVDSFQSAREILVEIC
jgi:hypothetical protein